MAAAAASTDDGGGGGELEWGEEALRGLAVLRRKASWDVAAPFGEEGGVFDGAARAVARVEAWVAAMEAAPASEPTLDLSVCGLSSLPSEALGDLNVHLISLSVANNRIERVPEGIERATRLERLDLHANRIDEVPPWLLQLQELRFLDVRGNKSVKRLPPELGRLPKLRQLLHDLGDDVTIDSLRAEAVPGRMTKRAV